MLHEHAPLDSCQLFHMTVFISSQKETKYLTGSPICFYTDKTVVEMVGEGGSAHGKKCVCLFSLQIGFQNPCLRSMRLLTHPSCCASFLILVFHMC